MDRKVIWNNYLEVGETAYRCGKYDIAERMLRAAVKTAPQIKDNHGPLSTVLETLADTLAQTHRYAKAELLYKRAIAIQQKHGGKPDNADVCRMLYKISMLHLVQNRFVLGKRWFGKALNRAKRCSQLPHQTHINYLLRIAWLLNQKGRTDDAIRVYNETLPIRKQMKDALAQTRVDFAPEAAVAAATMHDRARVEMFHQLPSSTSHPS